MDKLTELMAKMDQRRDVVIQHCDSMAHMFAMWRDAQRSGRWRGVTREIKDLIDFVIDNKEMLPNWRQHVEQYDFLEDVAIILGDSE